MNPITQDRVDRVRAYLLSSRELTEPEKDNLQELLDKSAAATNGHADKLQAITEVLHELTIHEIRVAIRMPAAIDAAASKAVAQHVAGCPLRGAAMPSWMAPLYAVRWPAAIVCSVALLSPHAVALVGLVLSRFKG